MDFLGNIEAKAKPFSTIYFSRVRRSHNFRLPLPFREGIRIEVENPTDRNAFGYLETQWDEVTGDPGGIGVSARGLPERHVQVPARGVGPLRHRVGGNDRGPLAATGRRPSLVRARTGHVRGQPRVVSRWRVSAELREPRCGGFLRALLGIRRAGIRLLLGHRALRADTAGRQPGGDDSCAGQRTGSRSGSRAGCCSPTSTTWASPTTTPDGKGKAPHCNRLSVERVWMCRIGAGYYYYAKSRRCRSQSNRRSWPCSPLNKHEKTDGDTPINLSQNSTPENPAMFYIPGP